MWFCFNVGQLLEELTLTGHTFSSSQQLSHHHSSHGIWALLQLSPAARLFFASLALITFSCVTGALYWTSDNITQVLSWNSKLRECSKNGGTFWGEVLWVHTKSSAHNDVTSTDNGDKHLLQNTWEEICPDPSPCLLLVEAFDHSWKLLTLSVAS